MARLFGSRKDSPASSDGQAGSAASGTGSTAIDPGRTSTPGGSPGTPSKSNPAKKGRPTPRRRDQERARGLHTGPVTAPTTRKEAKERRKAAEATMSKEERKFSRAKEREAREERRRLMMEGDDRYVLSRDRGEVRRYVRDWVDVHRRLINLFMPLALFFVFITFIPQRDLQVYTQTAFLAIILVFVIDGVFIGLAVNKAVRERFPDSDDHGFGLGWYGAMRATQPRFLRTPRPRVKPGGTF